MLKKMKSGIALLLTFTLLAGSVGTIPTNVEAKDVESVSLGGGSIAGGVTSELQAEVSKLPTLENSGLYRFTTDNYNNNNGAFDTNNWATSAMWNHDEGNLYSGSIYANPLSYWATEEGMWISKPSTRVGSTYVVMTQYNDGAFTDFNIKPSFEFKDTKVDNITDWTYDLVFENKSDSNQYLKSIIVQGSPFGFFELKKSNKVTIERKRKGNESVIVGFNGTSLSDSTYVVIRTYDPNDEKAGYSAYDYYGMYFPEGTKLSQSNNSATSVGDITLEFLSDKNSYFTVSWLCESDKNDQEAVKIAQSYLPYAYNFITDTRADYSYNEDNSVLETTYKYTVDKKAESKADGTIMGIMPHQYKNMDSTTGFLTNTARTIRGTVKYKTGSSFVTQLKFSGVLPYAPGINDTDKSTLQTYINSFISEKMPEDGLYSLCVDEAVGDPYVYGKQLNRSANVLAAAECTGDTQSTDKIMSAMKKSLADWFTYSGSGDGKYFAYYDGIGTLLSQPNSYDSINQMNDHHFHYGYFISAAAQVALRDESWAEKYNPVVNELIDDIACTKRNSGDSRYPYMRNFSPFEGHSWASGFEDINSGNNQESTSEAMNAWYGIIMYGMATGNDEIRDLGIYLYTTELSAINNYWFDIDGDVLDDNYVYQGTSEIKNNMASLVWSGKYDYGTWFSGDPAMVNGIQLMPITAGSYYLATDKDYIELSVKTLNKKGNSGAWNDVWSEYLAMADPDAGFENWSGKVSESGETTAHTYHYIKSLQKYGTPNTSITCNMPLSMVFEDSKGEKTYVVYNTKESIATVEFSDGARFSAKPDIMTILSESDMQGEEYYIEYYLKNLNGTYSLDGTDIKYADEGTNVTAEAESRNGYTLNTKDGLSVMSGKVTTSGLTLKLYYDRNKYTINYNLNEGVNSDNPTGYTYGETYALSNPTREGYNFRGWYADEGFTNKIESITAKTFGNLQLYARWASASDCYINDDMYLSYKDGNTLFTVQGQTQADNVVALYKIYDNESEARQAVANKNVAGYVGLSMNDENGNWTVSVDLSAYTDKYIVFVFNILAGTGSGLSEWGYCQLSNNPKPPSEETTQQVTGESGQPTTSDFTKEEYEKFEYYKINDTYELACIDGTNSQVISRTEEQGNRIYIAVNAVSGLISPNYKSITVNGVTDSNPAAGSNFWITISQLTKRYNRVSVKDVDGNICEFIVKNKSVSEETTAKIEPTETESRTETESKTETESRTEIESSTTYTGETETSKNTETTPDVTTHREDENIQISSQLKIEGFQINYKTGGLRTVSSIESEVNGLQVVEYGYVYGYIPGNITEKDLWLGSDSKYVNYYKSTNVGISSQKLGESDSAIYYVMTMTSNGSTKEALSCKYYVRTYAKLSDNTYVYSAVSSYSIFDTALYLYENKLMSVEAGYDYLYNNILKVVDSNYIRNVKLKAGDNYGNDIFTNAVTENQTTGKQQQQNTNQSSQQGTTRITIGESGIKSVIRKRTKAKLSLKTVKGADGYIIKYSTSKKFVKKKTMTFKAKKCTVIIKKIAKGKKYYFRVRAYKEVSGKLHFGSWSKLKKSK